MRCRSALRALPVAGLLGAVGACFNPALPPGAVVLCLDDSACPPATVCNTTQHICTEPGAVLDAAPPQLLTLTADRLFARAGDRITLDLTADEPLAAAALVLQPGVIDPGFSVELEEGSTTARFSATVGANSAEGFVAVEAVDLTDVVGNAGREGVTGVAVRIDRTPPTISAARATAVDASGLIADIAPYDRVAVALLLDEAPSTLAVSLGAATTPCAPDPQVSLGFVCIVALAAGTGDGANVASIEAVDFAGNAATAPLSVAVDAAPPAVAFGTARLALFDADGLAAPALLVGGSLVLDFDATEELSSATVDLEIGGATLPLTVTTSGRHVRGTLFDAIPPADGVAEVRATLTDRVGHATARLVVPLAPPLELGVPVATSVPSFCSHPVPGSCPDGDGDGAISLRDACAPAPGEVIDCDDTDETSFPGGLEIPDDGHDNDCDGRDVSLFDDTDDAEFVFVLCEVEGAACVDEVETDASLDGSRDKPFQDFFVAHDAAVARGASLVADGLFDVGLTAQDTFVAVPLLGGFRAADDWAPVPLDAASQPAGETLSLTRNTVLLAGGSQIAARQLVLGVGTTGVRLHGGTDIIMRDGARLVLPFTTDLVMVPSALAGTRVVGGFAGEILTSGDLAVVGTQVLRKIDVGGGRLIATSVTAPVLAARSGETLVVHGHVTGVGGGASVDNTSFLTLVNTLVDSGTAGFAFQLSTSTSPQRLELRGVGVTLSGGAKLLRVDGAPISGDASTLLACDPGVVPGCAGASEIDVVNSPAAPASNAVDPYPLGATAATVADLVGRCRPGLDGAAALGARE